MREFLRLLLITVSIILPTACGQGSVINFGRAPPKQIRSIEPEFLTFVLDFELYFLTSADYPIQFGDTGPDSVGLCYQWFGGFKEIVISKDYWDKIDFNQRRELIYHELGHCQLDLDHKDTETSFPDYSALKFPASIMRSYGFSSIEAQVMILHIDYYLQEMKESIK